MAFDPYCEWLAIPAGRRPSDYYELLGLPRFEPDAERIRLACIERSAFVRRFCLGPRGGDANRLLAEMAAALACLSDSNRKASYDRSLLDASPKLAPGEVVDDSLPPVHAPPDALCTATNGKRRLSRALSPAGKPRRHSRNKASVSARSRGRILRAAQNRAARTGTAIFLAAPILLIAVVVAIYFKNRGDAEASLPAPSAAVSDDVSHQTAKPGAETSAAAARPPSPLPFEPPRSASGNATLPDPRRRNDR